jgi:hypothetical protein
MIFKFVATEMLLRSWKTNPNRSALGKGCVKDIARFMYSGNHTGVQHKFIL